MDRLIGFTLIQAVIWFIIVMIGTSITNDWDHFYSNWLALFILTSMVSLGVYYLLK